MNKVLVAYFSATGTTEKAALALANAAGAEVYKIKPAVPYSRADLNWNDKNSRTSQEYNGSCPLPEIAEGLPDVQKYDVVFIGFPIWWYQEPKIIDVFLKSVNFNGVTIVPFATSGDSGIVKAQKSIAALAPNAKVVDGAMLTYGGVPNLINRVL